MEQHWSYQNIGSQALSASSVPSHWINLPSSTTQSKFISCTNASPINFYGNYATFQYHNNIVSSKVIRNSSAGTKVPARKTCSSVEPIRKGILVGKNEAITVIKDKPYSVLQQKNDIIYYKPQQKLTACNSLFIHHVMPNTDRNNTNSIDALQASHLQSNSCILQNDLHSRQSHLNILETPVHLHRSLGEADIESEGFTLSSNNCSSGYFTPNVLCESHRQSSFKENSIPTTLDVATRRENTLIILDYDDTLLPTNWVAVQNKLGLNDTLPLQIQFRLAELSELAIQTINFCRKYGKVIVVTNASIEWVNRSGEKFIPTVWRHLMQEGIEIVSARDRYQSSTLSQKNWKIKIFEETINNIFSDRLRDGIECSVISIGDGDGEREACLEMCRQLGLHDWLFKSLKLIGQPTCNQLTSEHVLIQQAFPEIFKVAQSLDMAILVYKNSDTDANMQNSVNSDHDHDKNVNKKQTQIQKTTLHSKLETPYNKARASISYEGTDAFVDVVSEKLKYMHDSSKQNSNLEKKNSIVDKTKLLKR